MGVTDSEVRAGVRRPFGGMVKGAKCGDGKRSIGGRTGRTGNNELYVGSEKKGRTENDTHYSHQELDAILLRKGSEKRLGCDSIIKYCVSAMVLTIAYVLTMRQILSQLSSFYR